MPPVRKGTVSMKITHFALLALFALPCAAPVSAQQTVPLPAPVYTTAPAPVPAEKAATIRRLLALMGTVKLSQQMMTQMFSSMQTSMPQVPAEFWTKVHASMNANELIDLLIPIYSRHYTQQELNGLIAFYQTPLGQKVVSELPQISQESMAVGQQWGQQKAQEIVKEMQQEQNNKTTNTTRQ